MLDVIAVFDQKRCVGFVGKLQISLVGPGEAIGQFQFHGLFRAEPAALVTAAFDHEVGHFAKLLHLGGHRLFCTDAGPPAAAAVNHQHAGQRRQTILNPFAHNQPLLSIKLPKFAVILAESPRASFRVR